MNKQPKTLEKKDRRPQRRERKKINDYLKKLVYRFFSYRGKLKDPDGNESVEKLSEINLEWLKYCNKKWKLGISPILNAFVDIVMDLIEKQRKEKELANKDITKSIKNKN